MQLTSSVIVSLFLTPDPCSKGDSHYTGWSSQHCWPWGWETCFKGRGGESRIQGSRVLWNTISQRISVLFLFFFCFWPCHSAFRIFISQPRVIPGPLAAKVQSPHHCTTREFPIGGFLKAAVSNLFGIRDQFCGRQFVDGVRWGRIVSGWFKCLALIMHFISLIITSAPPQIIKCQTQEVGNCCLKWYIFKVISLLI